MNWLTKWIKKRPPASQRRDDVFHLPRGAKIVHDTPDRFEVTHTYDPCLNKWWHVNNANVYMFPTEYLDGNKYKTIMIYQGAGGKWFRYTCTASIDTDKMTRVEKPAMPVEDVTEAQQLADTLLHGAADE